MSDKTKINAVAAEYVEIYGDIEMTKQEMWDAVIDYKQNNNSEALQKFIGANIKLLVREIVSIVRKPHLIDEYIGAAVAGLIDGIDKFDAKKALDKGVSTPMSYILHWVRAYIRADWNRDCAFVSGIKGTNKTILNKLYTLSKSADMTEDELVEYVANELNEPLHIVKAVYRVLQFKQTPLYDGDLNKLNNAFQTNDDFHELYDVIPIIKSILNETESYILFSRITKDKTLDEIGEELNVSKEAIRLKEKRVLKKLRNDSRMKVFADII